MKYTIYLFTLAITLNACNCKKKVTAKDEKSATEIKQENAKVIEEQLRNEKIPNETADYYDMVQKELSQNAVARIQKTSCFGRCPTYTMTFYNDGTVEYYGKKWVDKEGRYSAKVDMQLIDQLMTEAAKIGFFDMEDVYDKEAVTDLPSVITTVKNGDRFKTVVNRYGGPEQLTTLERYFESLSKDIDWQKAD